MYVCMYAFVCACGVRCSSYQSNIAQSYAECLATMSAQTTVSSRHIISWCTNLMRYKTHCTAQHRWGLAGINEFCIKQGDSINRSGFKLLQNGMKLISHSLWFDKSNFWTACVLLEYGIIGIFMSFRMQTISFKAPVQSPKRLVLIWFLRVFQFNLNIH